MKKLTPLQEETMDFLKKQIENARQCIKEGTAEKSQTLRIEEAIHGIVY